MLGEKYSESYHNKPYPGSGKYMKYGYWLCNLSLRLSTIHIIITFSHRNTKSKS